MCSEKKQRPVFGFFMVQNQTELFEKGSDLPLTHLRQGTQTQHILGASKSPHSPVQQIRVLSQVPFHASWLERASGYLSLPLYQLFFEYETTLKVS